MSAQPDDLDRSIYYAGSARARFKLLGVGLLLLGGGAFLLYASKSPLFTDGEQAYDRFLGVASVVAGLIFVFLHLRQVASSQPLLTLSRRGARLNIDGRTFVDVPWNEVTDVAVLDISARFIRPTGPIERLKPRGKGQGYYTRVDTITRTASPRFAFRRRSTSGRSGRACRRCARSRACLT